jgi:CheY-like chemotaxis protein
MTSLRILHVDDEPDIRELVELSLGLDPEFSVRSCASGSEALTTAADWSPDIILCDVMMPGMDGPGTLARLRDCPQTVNTPVVFMTARAQSRELEHFKSLGAAGVITKPFDPMALPDSVRCYLRSAGLTTLRDDFDRRLRTKAATLADLRASLKDETISAQAIEQIKALAHSLAGAAGIFGFPEVSCAGAALEQTAIDQLAGNRTPGKIEGDLDALLDCIKRA